MTLLLRWIEDVRAAVPSSTAARSADDAATLDSTRAELWTLAFEGRVTRACGA